MGVLQEQLSSFQREYLWELEIPKTQILALAEAIPEEAYGWRPAENARTFSAVLVHIAAGMLMLLYRADVHTQAVMEMCGPIEGEGLSRWVAMAHKGFQAEKTVTEKSAVLDLLKRAFAEVSDSFMETSDEDLGMTRDLFGEVTTVRRVYLRILAHTDEHMGQAVAYARCMGFSMPWPDPVQVLEKMAATTGPR